jgi:hypothetical protein
VFFLGSSATKHSPNTGGDHFLVKNP